jgi:hypothetical protein
MPNSKTPKLVKVYSRVTAGQARQLNAAAKRAGVSTMEYTRRLIVADLERAAKSRTQNRSK